MTALVIRGDARHLPLPDQSIDLVVTSPPFLNLRSYQDNGQHYQRQIGTGTQQQFLKELWQVTAEIKRVLKPTGSIFIELGDSYTDKSLNLSPHRFAIGCVDRLGLLLRAEIIWDRPNGLPESVTDRVRRSHSVWWHLTKQPRYYSAVDEIREFTQPHSWNGVRQQLKREPRDVSGITTAAHRDHTYLGINPLGKLPGSVWTIPTEPLTVPDHLGIDHFACVDAETEILTDRGWLCHDKLVPGEDFVAGYNLDTGAASWTGLHGVHRYEYDGDLVTVEKRDLSMRLTPNHRTLVRQRRGRTAQIGPVEVIEARDLGPRHYIPRSVDWQDGIDCKPMGADLVSLFGWVAAEGWYQRRIVRLSQSLDVNPQHVRTIDELVMRRGGQPHTTRHRMWRGRSWTDCQWKLPEETAWAVQRHMPDKLLPWSLLGLPEDERRLLLAAFASGDGHYRPDGRIAIFQKNQHNLDVLQAVAVTLGYKTTLRYGGERWVLYLTAGGRSITLRGTNGTHPPVGREHYRGIVWCPSTGTGTFIARRNGSVFITGNSFPTEWPKRLIRGWSPPGICTECGEGRRPVADVDHTKNRKGRQWNVLEGGPEGTTSMLGWESVKRILGYVCACTPHTDHPGTGERPTRDQAHYAKADPVRARPDVAGNELWNYQRTGPWREYHFDRWTPAPTSPAIVLDPFSGTGTTALVASALGRIGIGVDLSFDYCRLAQWRTTDRAQIAKVLEVPKPPVIPQAQLGFDFGDAS